MLSVDDVAKLPAINIFFIHPHLHSGSNMLQCPGIISDNPGNSRAPATKTQISKYFYMFQGIDQSIQSANQLDHPKLLH